MKNILTIITLTISLNLLPNVKQDSLLYLLNSEQNDSVKIGLLLKLSKTEKGENQLLYSRQALALDAKYDHTYYGYLPFFNIATYSINHEKIDSVVPYLNKALYYAELDNDTVGLARIYHSYSDYYRFIGKTATSKSYIQKSIETYQYLNDSFNYYRLLNNKAQSYFRTGDVDTAQALLLEVVEDGKHPRDSWTIAASNLGLGSLNSNRSDYQSALHHFLEAYNIWKELDDTVYFCKALNNIGIIYKKLAMHSMAMSTFQEIINTKPSGDPYAIPLALTNLSTINASKKNYPIAHEEIDQAIRIIDTINNIYYITALKNIKGSILIQEGRYEEARPIFKYTIETANKHNFSNSLGTALTFYSEILFKTNHYNEALTYSKRALENANKNANTESQFKNNYRIGQILVKQGKTALATPYLLKSLELNDSIQKEKDDDRLLEAALTYEIGKKEAINESLKKEAELNKTILEKTQAIVEQQRFNIRFITVFLVISLVLLFLLCRNNNIRRRLNKRLSDSNEEILSKNDKLNKLLNINGKIFSIISHDLKNPMISLHNSIVLLKRKNVRADLQEKMIHATETQVQTTLNLLENLLRWAKTHETEIQVTLSKVDTNDIIQQNIKLIEAALYNKEIQITNRCEEHVECIGDTDLIHIILRNLLSNAIKFTPRKGKIHVAAKVVEQNVVISVSDSGYGIEEDDIAKLLSEDCFITTNGTENEPGSGLGLKLCLNYIKYMNGEFAIKSTVGKGSTFIVKLPVCS